MFVINNVTSFTGFKPKVITQSFWDLKYSSLFRFTSPILGPKPQSVGNPSTVNDCLTVIRSKFLCISELKKWTFSYDYYGWRIYPWFGRQGDNIGVIESVDLSWIIYGLLKPFVDLVAVNTLPSCYLLDNNKYKYIVLYRNNQLITSENTHL